MISVGKTASAVYQRKAYISPWRSLLKMRKFADISGQNVFLITVPKRGNEPTIV